MASIPSEEHPMADPNDLDHSSASPSKTLAENPQNPLDVEEEPNLESNTENEIETEMKTENPQNPVDVEDEPNLASNTENEIETEMKTKNTQNPVDVEDEPNLESDSENETKTEMKPENKTRKSLGRPKKKEKQKVPVSETRNKPKPKTENGYDRPVYSSPFQDETRNVFVPSDLVWGKVKSHPWWPGQIFDPSDASELALKHRNKNNFLVAYYGDNTFAWNEASVLKPFQSNFSRMVKHSSTDSFRLAVDAALTEVSERVTSALSCGCYTNGESSAKVKIENTGIRADASSPSGDFLFIRRSFDPVKFLWFLCELGQKPDGGVESLDLAVAKSQLKAFNQSRGCNFDLPEFGITTAFEDETASPVTSDRIYTRKRKSIDRESDEKPVMSKYVPQEEGRKKKKLSEILNKKQMVRTPIKARKVQVGGPTGSEDSGKNKKKRLDSLGDLGTKSRARRKYLRVGQCMRRAETQVTQSKPTPKPNGTTSRKRKSLSMIKDRVEKTPLEKEKGSVSSNNLSKGKSGRKKKEVLRDREDDEVSFSLDDYSSSSLMFSQLCLAARDPLKGYGFITMITSFFSRFRDFVAKRSQGRSVSDESNSMGDVGIKVWRSVSSDLAVDDNDEEKLTTRHQKKKHKNREEEKEKRLEGNSAIPGANTGEDLGDGNKQEGNSVISDANGHEPVPEVEESMPTALVLNFKETAPLPTGPELNGLFTRFGPLKEAETEVSEKESSAQVVFERHADAEVAFSNAGKLDAFGEDLVSFQLSCAPTSSNVKATTSQVELQGEKDAASPVKASC